VYSSISIFINHNAGFANAIANFIAILNLRVVGPWVWKCIRAHRLLSFATTTPHGDS
jgi:hypothetical protein